MIDVNLIFVILVTIFIVFIVSKAAKLVGIIIAVYIFYYFYKQKFSNPKEFISYISNKSKEAFEPCSISNMAYCGTDYSRSNTTILPDILRSAPPNNDINKNVALKLEDYQIDKRLKVGIKDITIDEMIATVPQLSDYKIYLEKIVKFVFNLKTDDNIQKDFLIRKLRYKMTLIFYNAYNTVSDHKYPMNNYNELLYSQKEFDSTINIFIFLGLNSDDTYNLSLLQKEFKDMNDKLNTYVIEKVNDILPNDYDITTGFLPKKDDPQGMNVFDNYIYL